MPELITMGETMAVMVPETAGPLRYAPGFRLRMAGAESNTAIGLAKLGHSAGWISSLGEDELGYYVRNAIRAEGVDTTGVKMDTEYRTGLMLKQLSAGETSVFYYRENSAASHFSPEDVDWDYVKSGKILHLSGITPVLSKECEETVLALAEFAHREGIMISFDPNIRKRLWKDRDYSPLMRELMSASQIVLTGLDEAEQILGVEGAEAIVESLRKSGVCYIAIKDGARGAWVADTEKMIHIDAKPCRPIDPVGAGDGFNAGFLAGILEGRDLITCGQMGAIAGAMATEVDGDIEGYPSRTQMEIRLNQGIEIYR